MKCKHEDYWLFRFASGSEHNWCWRCGAFEGLNGWINPVGPSGKNPKDRFYGFKYVRVRNPDAAEPIQGAEHVGKLTEQFKL